MRVEKKKYFAGIHFRESASFKYFTGINFCKWLAFWKKKKMIDVFIFLKLKKF